MSSRRGFWTELLAFHILESLGFEIQEYRHRITRSGVEVAEIDALARKNNDLYAVEVKSGRISTTDIRQAFANAQLIGAKPLVVARGFADKSAEAYANELKVEVILIPDYLHFISTEELMAVMEEAILNSLDKLLDVNFKDLSEKELGVIRSLATSKNPEEACRALGMSLEEFSTVLGRLREKGVLVSDSSFTRLRVQARLVLLLRKAFEH
ncbi:MAG: recombinase RecB [Infirmifilum sp.]|jgi:predicted RecB family endonuclease|uniref:hypothetical protein n=1 Tax=Infirmifilum TaxID=2856573 RepID=UPI00069C3B84|nr:hypothetical protein [Infirmifilum uzonense]